MSNENLTDARMKKNDEFYTQYSDIQKEINAYLEYDKNVFKNKTVLLPCDDPEWSNFTKFFAQNFQRFGLKKLISTSFAVNSKNFQDGYQLSLFEKKDKKFDQTKTNTNGKIFELSKDISGDGKIDINDLEWRYLDGDGDFRSSEIEKLRDESDIIITNPPFSLFREFIPWIFKSKKKFIVIANKGAVTYKEIFPLFKENKIWSGRTNWSGGLWFETKDVNDVDKVINEVNMKNTPSIWLTNIEHGRRHQPLPLMSMKDNLKYSKHKEILGKKSYSKYDNYNAIEVPYTDAIPNDYEGVMGVPISFLDKYCPEQFEIIGMDGFDETPPTKKYSNKVKVKDGKRMKSKTGTLGCVIKEKDYGKGTYFDVGYPVRAVYTRIFIKNKNLS